MLLEICFLSIISVYLAICLFLYYKGESIIFPRPASSYTEEDPLVFQLSLAENVSISCTYQVNQEAKYTLLYSHGNFEDLGTIKGQLLQWQSAGFSVIAYDYPGYGTSQGKPTEKSVYEAIFAVYNFLIEKQGIDPKTIILYGFSVGGGPSIELALKAQVGGLIIQGAFLSAYRTITYLPIFPRDKFKNLSKITQLSIPVLVLHGKADDIVPFSHARKLFKLAKEPKFHLWVENADHNNFIGIAGQVYWRTLESFRMSF